VGTRSGFKNLGDQNNQRKTIPRMLSNVKKLQAQAYLGSPKNRSGKREIFYSNNADTPSNKHTQFDRSKYTFIKKKTTPHTNQFSNMIKPKNMSSMSRMVKAKNFIKPPHSTKNVTKKIDFYNDNLNFSRGTRLSGLEDSRLSENQFSATGSSVQSQAYNVYNSQKNTKLLLSKGSTKSRKGIFNGIFIENIDCYRI
jgi:hypothetical protein